MIDKELHLKLEKMWKKVGRVIYQKRSRVVKRMPFFLKYIHHFKGKDVLELGCNAGIYGYELAQVAKSYIGVDRGDYYIDQANITKKYIKNPNVIFYNMSVNDFIKSDIMGEIPTYNALFSSFALYHFADKETDKMMESVLPKCDIVIIQTRTKKRSPWKKYNSRKFWKPKNCAKYLEECGFKCKIIMGPEDKFAEIIGIRKEVLDVDDKRESDGDGKGADKGTGRRGTPGGQAWKLKGSKVLSPEREADAEGPDSVLPQVQEGLGPESVLQGGQREELQNKSEGDSEGVEDKKENGGVDTEVNEDSKGESGSDVQETED